MALNSFTFQAGKRVCFISLHAAISSMLFGSLVDLTITLLEIPGFAVFVYNIIYVFRRGGLIVDVYGCYGNLCLSFVYTMTIPG